mmetsp:Transcript_31874/g.64902  ORF Transcript_31874/g.64902 Transcript_31874/m.64902 type:complete len:82 (+) Transcript_31874:20-265(+)
MKVRNRKRARGRPAAAAQIWKRAASASIPEIREGPFSDFLYCVAPSKILSRGNVRMTSGTGGSTSRALGAARLWPSTCMGY